jgi:hypothetical protein
LDNKYILTIFEKKINKMKKIEIKKGQKFGKLIVIEEVLNLKRRTFKCLCECGKEKVFQLNHLRPVKSNRHN